jgi:hypothetical protein
MEKVHIIPLGLEYERVLHGINLYGVSKIYIIRGLTDFESNVEPYVEKLKDRYYEIVSANAFQEMRVDITDIGQIFSTVHTIMGLESENQLFFNVSSSTKLLATSIVFSVWCYPLDKLKFVPIIYYVIPKEYVHVKVTELGRKALDLSKHFDEYLEKDPEVLRSFVKEVKDLSQTVIKSGGSWGKNDKFLVEIPYCPIKAPSEFDRRILETLKTYGGEFDSVEKLVYSFIKDHLGITDRKKLKQEYKRERGKINYHLTELHNMRMIEKTRNGKKTRIKITSLGEVFTS